jgi:hypothetical protein
MEVIVALRTSIMEPHDHLHINHERAKSLCPRGHGSAGFVTTAGAAVMHGQSDLSAVVDALGGIVCGGVMEAVAEQPAGVIGSGRVGFGPGGAQVMSRGQADIGVQGGGPAPRQGDGGLVPPCSVYSVSSTVIAACPAGPAALRPRGMRRA